MTWPLDTSRDVGRYFRDKKRLIDDIGILKKEAADLSLEVARMSEMNEENLRLRALLDFKKSFSFKTVLAEIVARSQADWTVSCVINKGSKDGIRPESAVCSRKGLLGKTVETGFDTSLVMLVTHPSFRAGGVIKGSRINGVVAGDGSNTLTMLYLPLDANIEKGAIVATSGLSRIFPKGIEIGEVVSLSKSKTGLYNSAAIKPFANLFDEEEVLALVEK